MSLILPANSLTGGYEIANSLRFNEGSTDNLSKSFTASNRKTWTWSGWIKRANTNGQYDAIFTAGSQNFILRFGDNTNAQIVAYDFNGATTPWYWQSEAVFRDISAWYHIVFIYDTTQATSTNRIKLYVNGVLQIEKSGSSYPSLNYDGYINSAITHYIAKDGGLSNRDFSGYMSEIYFIDGQALAPTDFGEFDQDTNIWKPIKYTGTYGTNGFYLDFENSGSLGADQSGNGNNFTVNNLTSIDQVTDTPTNNFSTLNPLANGLTMSEGNLSVAGASDNNTGATIGVKSGKWYWEVKDVGGVSSFGIANSANRIGTSNQSSATGMYLIQSIGSGSWYSYTNGSFASTSVPVHSAGDILNFALDADNGKLYIGKNGSYINSSNSSANPATDTNPFFSSISTAEFLIPFTEMRTGGGDADFNFGNPPYSANGYTDGAGYGNFSYAVPSGFYSLNSKNLAQYG